ncbi:DUF7344 domain-containing protein [Halocatena pleomorpha]|uniref:DUF7344 domain-containing protein n=1 Tax=Halocatena pleomorpha TaxID=1785090 RepID=A0A3P3R6V3_9EURY|nr:hypothetical protein [Halocatena pleomorpha]RRJ29176.1 hypothetical protein EIK79_13650 [Halocatena pleomorpha]
MSDDSRDTPDEQLSESPSIEEISEMLSHHRRRYVIECLGHYESPMSLPDLADECVVMEHSCALDDIPAETVKDMYMSLYHNHIPHLVEIGAIEYDQERDLVTAGPAIEELHTHMDLSRKSLCDTAEQALKALRGAIFADGDCTTNGLTISHTRKTLRNVGFDEEAVGRLLHHLDRTGYIHFVGDCIRLVD